MGGCAPATPCMPNCSLSTGRAGLRMGVWQGGRAERGIACSVSMGALGSSAAMRAAAVTSLGLGSGLPAGLPTGLPASQPQLSASQPGSARPTSAVLTPADAPVQNQTIAKG